MTLGWGLGAANHLSPLITSPPDSLRDKAISCLTLPASTLWGPALCTVLGFSHLCLCVFKIKWQNSKVLSCKGGIWVAWCMWATETKRDFKHGGGKSEILLNFCVCPVKTRQWFSIIFISILHETAVGCTLVISAPVWELISSSKSLQQSEKGFFCPSSLSPFVLGWLMSQLYRDTPQCLSAFVLNQISHLWQKQVSEHQLQLFFFVC